MGLKENKIALLKDLKRIDTLYEITDYSGCRYFDTYIGFNIGNKRIYWTYTLVDKL